MKIKNLFEAAQISAAFAFGRFNPAHQGHIAVWRTVENAAARWYIGTNPSTLGPNDPLTFEQKSAWMAEIYPPITGHIAAEQSVMTLAAKIFADLGKNEVATIAYITDADDWAWSGKLLNQYNGVSGAHGYYKFAEIVHVPSPRVSSATALRDAARADDKVAFYHASGTDPKLTVAGKTYFDTVKEAVAKYPLPVKKAKKVAEGSQPNDIAVYHHTGPNADKKAQAHAMKLGSDYGHFRHDKADKNDNLHIVTQKRYFPDYTKRQGVAEVSTELRNRYVTRSSDDYSNANFAAKISKDHPGLDDYSREQEQRAKKRAAGLNRALSDKRTGREQNVAEGLDKTQKAAIKGMHELSGDEYYGLYQKMKDVAGHDGEKQTAPNGKSDGEIKDKPFAYAYTDVEEKMIKGVDPKAKKITSSKSEEVKENEQKTVAKTWDQMTSQEKLSGVKGRTVWNERTQRYYTVFDVPVKQTTDEASLATMRDYFAGDKDAHDPYEITKQRLYFSKDTDAKPTSRKEFRSQWEYDQWLKQNKLKQISGVKEDEEAGEVEQQGQLIPFPAGTTKVHVSDVYDWYKLGQIISDLDDADPADFGQGAPETVIAFGSEEEEHKLLPLLQRLGLKLKDIDQPVSEACSADSVYKMLSRKK